MKKILFSSALALTLQLHAETIGKVEYAIPSSVGDWKISDERQNAQMHTVLYTPKGLPQTESQEFFVLISTDQKSSSTKQDLIQQEIEKSFPGYAVTVKILKENPNDVLYEWQIAKGEQKMSGLSRGFNTNPGTAVLTFQVIGSLNESQRALWQEVLSKATTR